MLTFFSLQQGREREREIGAKRVSSTSSLLVCTLLYLGISKILSFYFFFYYYYTKTLLYYLLLLFDNLILKNYYCAYFMSVGSRFVAPGESGCRKRAREPLFAPRRYASALEPWTGLVYTYLLVYYYHCDGRRLGGGDASLVNRYYFLTGGRAHSLMEGTGRP